MFRRCALLLAGLTLAMPPLQAGTIHEVFSQTYTGTAALSTTDLLTPPTTRQKLPDHRLLLDFWHFVGRREKYCQPLLHLDGQHRHRTVRQRPLSVE